MSIPSYVHYIPLYPHIFLVGGLEHGFYFPFHIWDVILPIDELHHFSRWLKPPTIFLLDLEQMSGLFS